VNETWVDLRRYTAAVVNLFSGANSRVEAINVAGVDPQLKAALRNELDSLASALGRLLAPKWIFVEDLRGYLRRAKSGGFDSEEQRRDAWSSIRGEIGQIALAAREVLDIVMRPESRLNVVIPAADLVELENAMRTRGLLLTRFADLPAPVTAGELSALEGVVEQHERLRQITERLQVSLEAKRRMLT
jgi:hypothetical protein